MSQKIDVEAFLLTLNDSVKKNYALTELLAQAFSAFVVATDNKQAVADFIKTTQSAPEMKDAHQHAQQVLLQILESVKVAPKN